MGEAATATLSTLGTAPLTDAAIGRYDATRMYYRWTFMPAGKQRSRSLALIASRGVHDYTDRDLYTFGVYTGESLKFWLERLAALGVRHGPMWGFDSYEGLPAEAEGKKLESNAWLPGAFSAADQFDATTFGEVLGASSSAGPGLHPRPNPNPNPDPTIALVLIPTR